MRLTTGGCCVRPFWSPDGRQVWFLDRPTAEAVTAIWGIDAAGGDPTVITDLLGVFSPDARLVAYPSSDRLTYIQRTDGEERWVIPSGGRSITFSPDGQRIGWQAVSSQNGSYYKRKVELWLANVDGTDARKVITVTGGGIVGWFPNANRWLVLSSDLSEENYSLTVLDIDSANRVEIARAPRLGGASISPKGEWVVFQVTASGNNQHDGLWVVRSDGHGMRKLDVYGSYQWRSAGRLAIVPLELSANSDNQSHRLLEVEVDTGMVTPLTDPTQLSFRIANADWAMAPEGDKLAYVSAEDRNIWLIQLP
jgi:Tol biopolymer transport system component